MKRNQKSMYGISRIDNEKYQAHAWRVSLFRNSVSFVRNFPDIKHGGKQKALRAAKTYRDEVVAQYPPMTRKEYSNILRRNNSTGIVGVYRYSKPFKLKDGREKRSWYWEASWPGEAGKSGKATFSVSKYGEERARKLAIKARRQGLANVAGFFWASKDGNLIRD